MFAGMEMAEALREYLDFGVVLLVFGFGLTALGILAFQAFCIIWAPFAALICGLAARKRGLNVLQCMFIGAIYSALLFVPWMYIIRRIRNEQETAGAFAFDYDILFIMWGIWAFTTVAFVTFMMFWVAGVDLPPAEWSWTYLSREYLVWLMNGSVPVIGAFVLISSRIGVGKKRAAEEEICDVPDDECRKGVNIMPFAYFSANIIAVPITFLISVYVVIPIIWR